MLNKSYINGQLAYANAVEKGVNGVRGYIHNGVKTMGEQGKEVVLANALAAGTVKAGFETYDYINGKPTTSDNLLKSVKEVGYSVGMGAATSGMPIIPSVGLGVTVDWAKDNGKYDVTKATGGNLVGSVVESQLGSNPITPIIREIMTNLFEKTYDNYNKDEQYE